MCSGICRYIYDIHIELRFTNTCVFAFSKAILMLPCLMAFFTGHLAFCLFQLAIHSFI